MKVLVLSSARREPDFSCVYEQLGAFVDLELRVLEKAEQRNLRRYLARVDLNQYDRVLVDLHFKNIYRQTYLLSGIAGLLIYEEDACQNYLDSSRWRGRFSRFYRALPNARVVVTGAGVAGRLREEGFAVHFIPKGYDPRMIYPEEIERDIELGFIGRTASAAYAGRKQLLDQLAAEDSLQVLRTAPGAPYRQMLNRIRYFVSADVGLGEYMAKNFEAMACGCVLLAYDHGEEESRALGFVDMENIVLYRSVDDLCGKLAQLRADPIWAERIAANGKALAVSRYGFDQIGAEIVRAMRPPLRPAPTPGWFCRLRNRFGV